VIAAGFNSGRSTPIRRNSSMTSCSFMLKVIGILPL
jgi:hypothetical protein